MKREGLATRLGFILISAACAVGLGNVWRFPYVAGRHGGGFFVLVYLVCLALVGLPVLVMEFATGRASERSISRLHSVLTPRRPFWNVHAVLGTLGTVLLMMFYTTVTGWMLLYFIRMVRGSLVGSDSAALGAAFGGMLSDPVTMAVSMAVVSAVAAGVVFTGLQKGVERVTKVMMLGLLALIVAIAVRGLTLDASGEGLRYYLVPDLARVREIGLVTVVVEAMNHAFFTLSLGIGAMSIFGSYIGRERTLLGEALNVAVLDTFVAITAGLAIIPACFAYGVEPGQGPGLVFVTLPNVFNHMSGGYFWGSLFFLFLFCAALTTVIAVFECILACVTDVTGWSRRKASVLLALAIPVLSLPCVFGFNVWKSFEPLGAGTCVLDLEDFVVSNLFLPVGAVLFALYCTHRFGWGWQKFLDEVNAGKGPKFPTAARLYCAYVLPAIILVIFVLGLVDRFRKA